MKTNTVQQSPQGQEEQDITAPPVLEKKPWQDPKLAFVEPKLTVHGPLKQITGAGFFGGFTP